ncbi:MAG: hypothetical protein V7640_2510 [Betaproteobacteria bacterium]
MDSENEHLALRDAAQIEAIAKMAGWTAAVRAANLVFSHEA